MEGETSRKQGLSDDEPPGRETEACKRTERQMNPAIRHCHRHQSHLRRQGWVEQRRTVG